MLLLLLPSRDAIADIRRGGAGVLAAGVIGMARSAKGVVGVSFSTAPVNVFVIEVCFLQYLLKLTRWERTKQTGAIHEMSA